MTVPVHMGERAAETASALYFDARLAFSDRPTARLRTRTGQAWNNSIFVWITAYDDAHGAVEDQCVVGAGERERAQCVKRLVRKFDWSRR